MNISDIVSLASDKAVEQMVSEFNSKDNGNNSFEETKLLSKDYQLMMKYCNYLVEFALEEYSKQSK